MPGLGLPETVHGALVLETRHASMIAVKDHKLKYSWEVRDSKSWARPGKDLQLLSMSPPDLMPHLDALKWQDQVLESP